MTEPSPTRPVPGPPMRGAAGERAAGAEAADAATAADAGIGPEEAKAGSFAELEHLPVAEHVAVFEAEHTRLQDELSTIDQV